SLSVASPTRPLAGVEPPTGGRRSASWLWLLRRGFLDQQRTRHPRRAVLPRLRSQVLDKCDRVAVGVLSQVDDDAVSTLLVDHARAHIPGSPPPRWRDGPAAQAKVGRPDPRDPQGSAD